MPARRLPWPVDHLVAVGGDQHRPAMLRTSQYDERAHSAFAVSPHRLSNSREARGARRPKPEPRAGKEGPMSSFADRERVVDAQFDPGGDKAVIAKVAADLGARDPTITAARVAFELEHFAADAKHQLMRE